MENDKGKKTFLIIVSIAMLLFTLIGATFAWFAITNGKDNVNLVTTGTLQIRYTDTSNLYANNLKPATDTQVLEAFNSPTNKCIYVNDVANGVVGEQICAYKTFTITNIGTLTAYVDIFLEDITNTYVDLKYQLFETVPQTLSGTSLTDVSTLVSGVEMLKDTSKTYTLLIWLDEGATLETITNKAFGAKITANAKTSNETGNNTPTPPTGLEDPSNANRPVLADGMIPVIHNGTTWVKANATGDYNQWYDYGNKMWANAVMVSSATRDTYMTADVGTPVQEADILAYFVWIPRYKYQLFNVEFDAPIIDDGGGEDGPGTPGGEDGPGGPVGEDGSGTSGGEESEVEEQLINIQFESGTATTGNVTCQTSEIGVETCSNKVNGNWYTHPAFTFGNEELQGIWVGKFETTYGTNTSGYPGNTVYSTPTIKPNVTSLRVQQVSKQFQTAQYFGTSAYLTNAGVNQVDAHMVKNIEWGAVAYLKQSAYGLGTTDITLNSNNSYLTGCGPQSAGSTSSGSICNAYHTTLGMSASTTGNIKGVYDMSGGAYEYVMGVIQDNTTTGRSPMSGGGSSSNSGYIGKVGIRYNDSGNTLAFPAAKYYDLYANGTTTYHLGDATGETANWYNDNANFPYAIMPWFERGGDYGNGFLAGVFSFNAGYGDDYSTYGFRVALSTTGA